MTLICVIIYVESVYGKISGDYKIEILEKKLSSVLVPHYFEVHKHFEVRSSYF